MTTQVNLYLDRARMAARIGVIGRVTEVGPGRRVARARAGAHLPREAAVLLARLSGRRALPGRAAGPGGDAGQPARQRLEVGALQGQRGRRPVPAAGGNGAAGGWLEIRVDDDGPGLHPSSCAEPIARGRRLDETKPGSGLGHSIVADLAYCYNGKFELAPVRGRRPFRPPHPAACRLIAPEFRAFRPVGSHFRPNRRQRYSTTTRLHGIGDGASATATARGASSMTRPLLPGCCRPVSALCVARARRLSRQAGRRHRGRRDRRRHHRQPVRQGQRQGGCHLRRRHHRRHRRQRDRQGPRCARPRACPPGRVRRLGARRAGRPVRWRNPDNGRYGEIVPEAYYDRSGSRCRDFLHSVWIEGRRQRCAAPPAATPTAPGPRSADPASSVRCERQRPGHLGRGFLRCMSGLGDAWNRAGTARGSDAVCRNLAACIC